MTQICNEIWFVFLKKDTTIFFWNFLTFTGWTLSFHTICMWICGSLVHVIKKCRKLQILIGIIPTFFENLIKINQVWSEAILRIYTGLDHFIIDSFQNGFWRLPLINWKFNWGQFHLSINIEFPVYQWQPPKSILEVVNDKMVQNCVNSENGLGSCLKL